jgi:hypothetical protein
MSAPFRFDHASILAWKSTKTCQGIVAYLDKQDLVFQIPSITPSNPLRFSERWMNDGSITVPQLIEGRW